MTWYPTNTDDITLVISRVIREDGGRNATELTDTSAIVVDDFSIDTEEDFELLSGIGNPEPQGTSKGDIEHSFSFTVQGEDAELFDALASDDTGRSVELEIVVIAEEYKDKVTGAWAGTRNISGSSGDALEFEVEGVAESRSPGVIE